MAKRSRAGFFSLIVLFLRRMPSVWVGGCAATIVTLIVLGELGQTAAGAGVALVVAASLAAEFWIDRRRDVGRRILFRGPAVSLRRVAVFVVTLALVAAVTSVIAANFFAAVQKTNEEDALRRNAPPRQRGPY